MAEDKVDVAPNTAAEADEQGAALLQAGKDYANCKAPDKARSKFEAVLARDPEHTEAHYRLGKLLHAAEAYELAETHYRAALEGVPSFNRALLDLGALYEQQGRPTAAAELYERCIESDTCPERIAQARAALAELHEQPFQVCRVCGRFTTLEDFSASGSGKPHICPRCYGEQHTQRVQKGVLMLWVYLFLINLMLWPLVIGMDDTPLYLWVNNTVALLLLYLMLPLHELAHAGVCWVLGGKVHEIRVGIGRPVWTTTWRETKVAVHQYPAGGFCRTSFPTRAQILLRTFLTYAAGVAFSGAVIALLLPAYQGSQWLQGLAWREALVWVNGFILIFNLWPREGNVGTIRGATDGAKMLKILRGQFPAEVCHIHHYVVESMYAIRARDFARAAERSRKGISQYPDSPHLKNVRAIALLELGRGADAAALFKEQLDALEAQGPGKMLGVTEENYILLQAMLRNNLVAALLFGPDDPEAASSLLDYAQSAYLLMPWHHAVESTWGGALVEEGRVELGLAYLQAAYPAHETDHERAGTLASIAWAQHLLGEEAESEAAMQQALTLDAEHPVVKKVQAKGPFTNNFPI